MSLRRLLITLLCLGVVAGLIGACGSTSDDAATTLSESHGVVTVDGAGLHLQTVHAGGRTRSYLLYVPPGTSARHPLPLVLVYHGADSTAAEMVGETGLVSLDQQRHDMIIAFLQGYQNTWNDDAGDPPAEAAHVNDIAFTRAVLAVTESHYPIDDRRVVATGISNGAIFTELLGCRLASDFTMIVPVEGQIAKRFSGNCRPSEPISVFEIHATADSSIPYNGGTFQGIGGPVTVLSAPASAARWAVLNGCSGTPAEYPSMGFQLRHYLSCRQGVSVTLATVEGGGHVWPPNFNTILATIVRTIPGDRRASTP